MTREEFNGLLQDGKFTELLEQCLHKEDTPYVFAPKPATWNDFRAEVADGLGVTTADIRVVGSARFGFSMKPSANLAAFRDTSDVDIVVVSPEAFDELWSSLLRAAYPRPPVSDRLGGWLQKRKNEVYTGWLTPLEIHLDARIVGDRGKPVLEVRTRWFNTLKLASRHPPRKHEDISGRLYRTWAHAELYHLNSLAELRRAAFA